MRIRRIGAKSKHSRSSEEALFQEILFQSSQIKRHAAGIYGFGHFLVKARNKIVNIIVNDLEDFVRWVKLVIFKLSYILVF